jgi:predicted RNase H-like HicB family nuclease
MSLLQHTIKAMIIEGDESGYVGSCFGLPVVTQGATLDEVMRNLREAVALHFEGEDEAAVTYTI